MRGSGSRSMLGSRKHRELDVRLVLGDGNEIVVVRRAVGQITADHARAGSRGIETSRHVGGNVILRVGAIGHIAVAVETIADRKIPAADCDARGDEGDMLALGGKVGLRDAGETVKKNARRPVGH